MCLPLYFKDHLTQVLTSPERGDICPRSLSWLATFRHSPHSFGPPQGLSFPQSVNCNTHGIRGPTGPWVSDSSRLSPALVNLSGKKRKGVRRHRLNYDSLAALGKGQELEDQRGSSRNSSSLRPKTGEKRLESSLDKDQSGRRERPLSLRSRCAEGVGWVGG